MELEKNLQDKVGVSWDESTQTCNTWEIFKGKETKLCLENETITKEKSNLLETFQELEKKLKGLEKDLKELNEPQILHQSEERYDLWREYAQAHKDYEVLKMRKHNIWVKCKEHKRAVKFLNDKLLKNQEVKGQPQDVEIGSWNLKFKI